MHSTSQTHSQMAELIKKHRKAASLLLQKEYVIASPYASTSVLACENIRSSYVITLYHPQKSCCIHWDLNTRRSQLEFVIDEFLSDELTPATCQANVAGGWHNDAKSTECGQFITDTLMHKGFQITTTAYQSKSDTGQKNHYEEGFALMLFDTKNNQIQTFDWPVNHEPWRILTRDTQLQERYQMAEFLDLIHYQSTKHPESGTPLMAKDQLAYLKSREARAMIQAAKTNDTTSISRQIDQGGFGINASPKEAKGATPLHIACINGHFECAKLLVENGADIQITNHQHKRPLNLWTHKDKDRLSKIDYLHTLWAIRQHNLTKNRYTSLSFAMFSRHPDQLCQSDVESRLTLDKLLCENELCQEAKKKL